MFLYPYFYRFRLLPCHLCFFSFFIFSAGGGVCFSCGFLVSVLWMVFGLFLAPPFASFCPSHRLRFALRLVSPFRSSLRLSLRSSVCFSVWACRGSVCGSRRFCQLVGNGRAFVLFRVLIPWGDVGACRIVDVVGSADGAAGRLCGAYGVPCGGVWSVSLGEASGGGVITVRQ